MRTIRGRLTYANVMATIAVFLALGGISWAAATLPKNSVGNAQLKKNAVTGAKVKNGSLTSSDFKKGTLKAGPQGPAGPAGSAGAPGAAGVVEARSVRPATAVVPLGVGGFTTVAELLDVPAGAWVVTAKVVLLSGTANNDLLCSLSGGGADDGDSVQAISMGNAVAGRFSELPLTLTSIIRLPVAGPITLTCSQTSATAAPTGASTVAPHIVATRATTAVVSQ